MLEQLKRIWFYNHKEIKLGAGSLLSCLGLVIVITSFPFWIFKSLVGGAILGGGIKLLSDL